MEGVSEGRIVHYVPAEHDDHLSKAHREGRHLAAIIVRDWKSATGVVNLIVFPDGRNDLGNERYLGGGSLVSGVLVESRAHDPEGTPGTWHWPERA